MTLVRKKPPARLQAFIPKPAAQFLAFLHQSAPTHHRAACKSSRSPAANSLGAYFRTSAVVANELAPEAAVSSAGGVLVALDRCSACVSTLRLRVGMLQKSSFDTLAIKHIRIDPCANSTDTGANDTTGFLYLHGSSEVFGLNPAFPNILATSWLVREVTPVPKRASQLFSAQSDAPVDKRCLRSRNRCFSGRKAGRRLRLLPDAGVRT